MNKPFEIIVRNLKTGLIDHIYHADDEVSASYMMAEHQISYGSGYEVTYRPSQHVIEKGLQFRKNHVKPALERYGREYFKKI